jgi:hypothetical protein
MANVIALKHLTLHTAIWYRDSSGAHHAADITAVDTTLKSWGVVKIKVVRHRDALPLWITRKQVLGVCD